MTLQYWLWRLKASQDRTKSYVNDIVNAAITAKTLPGYSNSRALQPQRGSMLSQVRSVFSINPEKPKTEEESDEVD